MTIRGYVLKASSSFILIIISLLPLAVNGQTVAMGGRNQPLFEKIHFMGTESIPGSDSTQDIILKPQTRAAGDDNLLVLDFENEIPIMLIDESGNYQVKESGYIKNSDARSGQYAALFQLPDHGVAIAAPEELWPGTDTLDDFTIEVWIKPFHYFSKNDIFKKTSTLDGLHRGMTIGIQKAHLVVSFDRMFTDRYGGLHSLKLISRSEIKQKQWTHVALSYNAATGKIVLFIDGQEESVIFAKKQSEILRASFHPLDRSPILIGSRYSGLMDDFVISQKFIDGENLNQLRSTPYRPLRLNYSDMTFRQDTGIAVSEVISLSRTGKPGYAVIHFEAEETGGSQIEFQVRYAGSSFSSDARDTGKLQWHVVENGSHLPEKITHIQWRAIFKSDAPGKSTPVLKEVSLQFTSPAPPSVPDGLHVIDGLTENDTIAIAWKGNPEPEIEREGGYIIYYGLKPGEYHGRIKYKQFYPEALPIRASKEIPLSRTEKRLKDTNPGALDKKMAGEIRMIIDNRVIEENILAGERREMMPPIRPGFTYYIAISSYAQSSGESELSPAISVKLRRSADFKQDL